MRTVYFDSDFRFDDPNIRWGEPSYLLEPGDPGYVPPALNPTKPKTKHMKHTSWYPLRQAEQIIWLTNFCNKIGGYAAALSLSSGQITAVTADCGWLIYLLQSWLPAVRAWSMACTDAVTLAQTGTGASPQVLPVFTAPELPDGVAPVNPGALDRIFLLIQQIKDGGHLTSPLDTDPIATDLGIVGEEMAGPDEETLQPVITGRATSTGVEIGWNWGGFAKFLDALLLQVDRGDGLGFRLLVHDTTPGYKDTQAFPATLTRWTYRAIYIRDDAQVGLWSNPVSVTVQA